MIRGYWSAISLDQDRRFVYGPIMGRLYLLSTSELQHPVYQKLLGLSSFSFHEFLLDPARLITHDLPSLRGVPPAPSRSSLLWAYRLFRASRHFVSYRLMARLLSKTTNFRRSTERSISEIGRLIHGVERSLGYSDCYPRALMTLYLCLSSGRNCDLTIGLLAPTRKMHAWCSSEGQLPYEALPEHYMYQPLMVMHFSRLAAA